MSDDESIIHEEGEVAATEGSGKCDNLVINDDHEAVVDHSWGGETERSDIPESSSVSEMRSPVKKRKRKDVKSKRSSHKHKSDRYTKSHRRDDNNRERCKEPQSRYQYRNKQYCHQQRRLPTMRDRVESLEQAMHYCMHTLKHTQQELSSTKDMLTQLSTNLICQAKSATTSSVFTPVQRPLPLHVPVNSGYYDNSREASHQQHYHQSGLENESFDNY